jgi:GT2 family glycosyltransferase
MVFSDLTGERSVCISVVIPSLKGEGEAILTALQKQHRQPDEVQVVKGVQPNGKARNLGAEQTRGEILLFIDDDATPGDVRLVESLVSPLLADPSIGVTGAARRLPNEAPAFQQRVAREIPRTVNHVPQAELETNPPLSGYGHSLITTTCCAMRRSVFEQAGRFSEQLTSGVDTDFFYRVRKLGYRFVMVPDVFVYHPAPQDLGRLWRKFYWYGMGYGQEVQRRPEQKMGIRLPTGLHRAAFLLAATLWFLPNIFFLYSPGYPKFKIGFRPLKALSTYAVAWGYAKAWQDGGSGK